MVKKPEKEEVLKSGWVYKLKTNPQGEVKRFKARFIVKGYSQREGIDYKETFSPVARYETIRMMLAIAAAQGLDIIQFDVATAFLNSTLSEDIYMQQPQGYERGDPSEIVCKLKKGLYGHKQASREWYVTLTKKLNKMGFKAVTSDPCLFVKTDEDEENPIYIVIYVDDGMIIGRNLDELNAELEELQKSFKLSIQPLTRFLGIEIKRTQNGIFIHQHKYTVDLLKRFNMSECKTLDVPMQPGLHLEGSIPVDMQYPYQELIGSLLFLVRCTRPDIAYAVHYLSRYFTSYDKTCWMAAKKILQYLQGTMDLGIFYRHEPNKIPKIFGYVDAD